MATAVCPKIRSAPRIIRPEAYQSLVDHLFEKTIKGLCYLTVYRHLTKAVSERLLEKADPLAHTHVPGLTNDWLSRESCTMDVIRPYVRNMIKDQNNLASKGGRYLPSICPSYT